MGYFQHNVYDVKLWHAYVTIANDNFDGTYTAVQKFGFFKMFYLLHLIKIQ